MEYLTLLLIPIVLLISNSLIFNSDCAIKIGDYYIQEDDGNGNPILRKRIEKDCFKELYKHNYYPLSRDDNWFDEFVQKGHYRVISQTNPEVEYSQYCNKHKF